jgi:hypothetical protein
MTIRYAANWSVPYDHKLWSQTFKVQATGLRFFRLRASFKLIGALRPSFAIVHILSVCVSQHEIQAILNLGMNSLTMVKMDHNSDEETFCPSHSQMIPHKDCLNTKHINELPNRACKWTLKKKLIKCKTEVCGCRPYVIEYLT